MEYYNIRYNKTANTLLAIILPPLVVTPVFIIMGLYLPGLPEWAVFAIITGLLGVALWLTFMAVKKVNPKGILTLNKDGFVVDFPERTLFTPTSFEVKTSEISNFYILESQGNYSLCFATNVTPPKFNISAASKTAEDISSFILLAEAMQIMIDEYNANGADTNKSARQVNESEDKPPITNISVYQRGWVKVTIVISGVVLFAITILNIIEPFLDKPGMLKIVVVLIIGIPIAIKVFKRKKAV